MRYRNAALFLALAAVWGVAFMAIKAGLAYFPPVLFAAVRYDVAGVLMLGYARYATDHALPRGRAEWLLVAVGATFMIAGYHAFLFVGEQTTSSAAAAVVVSLSPVLTTAFARLLVPEEALSPAGVVGLLVGLAGVAMVAFAGTESATLVGSDAVGELLVFGAAASFALGSVLARRSSASLPVETMEAWSMVGGALLMHVLSLALAEPQVVPTSLPALAALGYLSLVASAAGFLVYFDLLDRLGPVEINLVSYVAPVFAALSAWLLLSETPTATTAGGFAAIFLGFCMVKRNALRRELPGLWAALGR